MMLLMGMKISLTKKPTNPITTNPIAVRNATFVNSAKHTENHSSSKPDPARTESNHGKIASTETENPNRGNRSAISGMQRPLTLAIGLVAPLDEADAVLGELPQRIHDRVHGVHLSSDKNLPSPRRRRRRRSPPERKRSPPTRYHQIWEAGGGDRRCAAELWRKGRGKWPCFI